MAPWKIVIAEKGFIFAGRVEREGEYIVIRDCFNIRRYSLKTQDGLGGLAERGPGAKENDVLDKWNTTKIHVLASVADQECNEGNWENWFSSFSEPKARRKR
jgi:hypothetical protein